MAAYVRQYGTDSVAGIVFVGGSLIALWPDAREERRLAERYEGAAVQV